MDMIILASLGLKIVVAVAAFFGAMAALRFMSRSIGLQFKGGVTDKLAADPMAAAIYMGARLIAVALLIGLVAGCTAQAAAFTTAYDRAIKGAAERWWPDYPFWRAWKAQLIAESALNPNAVSPVGAVGLAQMLPGTWGDVSRAMQWGIIDRRLAEPAIEGGAWYVAKLKREWRSKRTADDRHRLGVASYNAGLGSLLSAQRLCGGRLLYDEIIACLPDVTGELSDETITYVKRVWDYWARLELGV